MNESRERKLCKYCAEAIYLEAQLCRFCGRNQISTSEKIEEILDEKFRDKENANAPLGWWILTVGGLIFLWGLLYYLILNDWGFYALIPVGIVWYIIVKITNKNGLDEM